MPNHVTNQIEVGSFRAQERNDVKDLVLNEEGQFDFNRLIPMPEEVVGTHVGTGGYEMDDPRGWYGWSNQHWGTKWNAYETEVIEYDRPDRPQSVHFRFYTAWSPPFPVIRALFIKLQEMGIHATVSHFWSNEDASPDPDLHGYQEHLPGRSVITMDDYTPEQIRDYLWSGEPLVV